MLAKFFIGLWWGPPSRGIDLRHRRPPTGVSDGVSPKIGVSDGVSGGASPGNFGPRPPECPKSVPRVSVECQKGVRTLRGHSRDTFWTLRSAGPEGLSGHPPGHSVRHPDFRGHSVGHSRGHSGPKGPRDSCRGPTMSQASTKEHTFGALLDLRFGELVFCTSDSRGFRRFQFILWFP